MAKENRLVWPRLWAIRSARLPKRSAVHRRLKYAMDKAGIGTAIGGIDFSLNEDQEGKFKPFWNVHLYAITSGEKEQLSRQLKAIVQYSNAVPRPKRVTSFENKAIRRSYALKMHFERRIGYDEIKIGNGKRPMSQHQKRSTPGFCPAGNAQQQETAHNAEVFVKALQAVDVIRTFHCPVAMPEKRCSQRVQSHECGRGTRERANGNRERNRKLHED
jgi:hypothetical protein